MAPLQGWLNLKNTGEQQGSSSLAFAFAKAAADTWGEREKEHLQ